MRTYKTEFPDYDGDFELLPGFVDDSWHNDACPCMLKGDILISVDYVDEKLREFPDVKRFMVLTLGRDETLLETDDWSEVVQFIKGRA